MVDFTNPAFLGPDLAGAGIGRVVAEGVLEVGFCISLQVEVRIGGDSYPKTSGQDGFCHSVPLNSPGT